MYFNMKENDEKTRVNANYGELPPDNLNHTDDIPDISGDDIIIED